MLKAEAKILKTLVGPKQKIEKDLHASPHLEFQIYLGLQIICPDSIAQKVAEIAQGQIHSILRGDSFWSYIKLKFLVQCNKPN